MLPHRVKVGSPEDELFLQPWFVPKDVYAEIRRILPPSQMLKMRYYFEDYGCLKCGELNVLYGSNGFCRRCSIILRARVALSLKRRFKKIGVMVATQPLEDYLRGLFGKKNTARIKSEKLARRAR